MSFLQALFMGLIQGLTEFLPVSSSGHLAIFQSIFHIKMDSGILFDIMLHIGTLVAIFVVYYKDIFKMILETILIIRDCFLNMGHFFHNLFAAEKVSYLHVIRNSYRKFVLMIIVSTIPTGVIGILLKDFVTEASKALLVPGICLIVTGILLLISDHLPEGRKKPATSSYKDAVFVGICQGIATLPGLSRSGTTITACLASGFDRKFAVKYSFIMSIPAILGAAILEIKDITPADVSGTMIMNYLGGMIVAGVVGYICIKTMLVIVRKKKFTYFAAYCFLIGTISVVAFFRM